MSCPSSVPTPPHPLTPRHTTFQQDFLWVRWFGKEPKYISGSRWAHLPKVGFVESTDEFAFSFVDPANIVCGWHLVPAFHEGHTVDLLHLEKGISAIVCQLDL